MRYRDKDGDVWEGDHGGELVIVEANDRCDLGWDATWDDAQAGYGPLIPLDAPQDAPLTRAEFAEFVAEMRDAFDVTNGSPRVAYDALTRWVKKLEA
ncbi:hypothetical protein ABZY06_33835 [Streptomyces sp. NPDC006540]|uniref:hypothetical protein n=1 Tax=Streptomyces sp. NPDC006540 TaxID=3155353 RepID=UPI0033A8924A